MSLKLKVLVIILLLIFIFPQKAHAMGREYIIWFDEGLPQREGIDFIGEFSQTERAWVIFYNLLCRGKSNFVPNGVEIINITITDRHLMLNLSPQIMNYGGIYNERHLKAQIVLTALEMEDVEKVTLLIDGELGTLPEGSSIIEVGEWEELMD